MAVKVATHGELQRVDVAAALELLPSLREEWARLQFASEGGLINPLTGEVVPVMALIGGRHRQPGAAYRVTVASPKLHLPEGRRGEFAKESKRLARRNAKQEQWDEHHLRRREASVQVGVIEEHYSVVLEEDTVGRVAFSVSDDAEQWRVRVEVEDEPWPKVHFSGDIDLTAMWRAEGTPGCVAGLLGGTGSATATFDTAPLHRGGQLLEMEGRANRFRGRLRLEIEHTSPRWVGAGEATLRAVGLARPVLWFAGRRVNARIARSLKEFWTAAERAAADLEGHMCRLRAGVAREGSEALFVRRFLWDSSFDRRL